MALFLLSCQCETKNKEQFATIQPYTQTSCVPDKSDDCAIWVHPSTPELSIIIGSNSKKQGALYAWDLQGKKLFSTPVQNHPTHLDIRYQFILKGKKIDIVACSLRDTNNIKIFSINSNTQQLQDITTKDGIATGFNHDTHGFALYQRPKDGALFAFVSSSSSAQIHQIQLLDDGNGKIKGNLVRSFGKGTIQGHANDLCVDDNLGYIYCVDKRNRVIKFSSDPLEEQEARVLCPPNPSNNNLSICLYKESTSTGFLIISHENNNKLDFYSNASDNPFLISICTQGIQQIKSIEVTSRDLGPHFPQGGLVCQNSSKSNFVLYDWRSIDRILHKPDDDFSAALASY
jgi:3-phytase